tara:strand:+ start:668 stop:874 length:207 start_codon:yes stop_codon:yes gene_type:complete
MKKIDISNKDEMIYGYLDNDTKKSQPRSSDINVLLNRIKLNKKSENRKKIYFSAIASTGLILFGLFIF